MGSPFHCSLAPLLVSILHFYLAMIQSWKRFCDYFVSFQQRWRQENQIKTDALLKIVFAPRLNILVLKHALNEMAICHMFCTSHSV